MFSLLLSTLAFVVASYLIKRYFERIDIPKSLTRSAVIFTLALAVAYGVAALVDWISG